MKSLLVAPLFGVSLLPGLCFAQVQLPTVNLGLTNFEDGARGIFGESFNLSHDEILRLLG